MRFPLGEDGTLAHGCPQCTEGRAIPSRGESGRSAEVGSRVPLGIRLPARRQRATFARFERHPGDTDQVPARGWWRHPAGVMRGLDEGIRVPEWGHDLTLARVDRDPEKVHAATSPG